MRKKILIFIIAIMGMFAFINAKTVEMTVTSGGFKSYYAVGVSVVTTKFRDMRDALRAIMQWGYLPVFNFRIIYTWNGDCFTFLGLVLF